MWEVLHCMWNLEVISIHISISPSMCMVYNTLGIETRSVRPPLARPLAETQGIKTNYGCPAACCAGWWRGANDAHCVGRSPACHTLSSHAPSRVPHTLARPVIWRRDLAKGRPSWHPGLVRRWAKCPKMWGETGKVVNWYRARSRTCREGSRWRTYGARWRTQRRMWRM